MKMETAYDQNFYSTQRGPSLTSAMEVVPFLINTFHPKSVLDVGCGVGTWLKVFEGAGVTDFVGVDGAYVDKEKLSIPEDNFLAKDISKDFSLGRKFDLVLSLEVGEHIAESSSDFFVDNITKHGDIIVFSAAIQFQGGTDHINEQMQDYWIRKFEARGFSASDVIRRKFWDNSNVMPHYKQNVLLLYRNDVSNSIRIEIENEERQTPFIRSVVHPEVFMSKLDHRKLDVRSQISFVLKIVKHKMGLIK